MNLRSGDVYTGVNQFSIDSVGVNQFGIDVL